MPDGFIRYDGFFYDQITMGWYTMSETPIYKRILLKLSGEALMGSGDYGIDPDFIARVATEIKQLQEQGVQVAVVIGGGNIFRGAGLAQGGMDRVTGDHIGMLATVMNSLAMKDALIQQGLDARVLSALSIAQACEDYSPRLALEYLQKGAVTILAAGTGNPFFTTDSAASLRAIEIKADVMLKATKVNGVYDSDPMKNPAAKRYERISYDQVLNNGLGVMDTTATVLCREHGMPLRVFNLNNRGDLWRLMIGEDIGTVVEQG